MTVRRYELVHRPCSICGEPTDCAIPFMEIGVQICVEGGTLETMALCESCIYNLQRPFLERDTRRA